MFLSSETAEKLLNKVGWLDEGKNFMLPEYEGRCLSNLPWSIFEMLSSRRQERALPKDLFGQIDKEKIERVILILVDGFGFGQLLKQKNRLCEIIKTHGVMKPITTVFPSTTAAALTSLSTGLTPQEHGLLEWYIYLEEIGEIIASLPFSPIGSRGRDILVNKLSPRVLFEGKTIYSAMKKEGVRSFTFLGRNIAGSSYSKTVHRGSLNVPYSSSSDMFVNLRKQLSQTKERSYFYLYWSSVDTIEHIYGPSFEASKIEFELFTHALLEGLVNKLDTSQARNTILMITSDHGQIDIEPEVTIYLNRFRKLKKNFLPNLKGKPIEPTGSARDVFLHVKEKESMLNYLRDKLDGVALVLDTEEATERGLFGIGKQSSKFLNRRGQILILPYSNRTVWYKFSGQEKLEMKGHHGSLTPDELVVPFLAVELGRLVSS